MSVKTEEPTNTSVPEGEGEWDEARLTASLAKLQDMHIKLRQLRNAVPSMLQPIHNEQPSPESLYLGFSKAATTSLSNVKEFVTLFRDPASQEIFKKSKESKEQDPEVMGWIVSQHADWLDKPSPGIIKEQRDENEDDHVENEHPVGGNVAEDVVAFKAAHPKAQVSLEQSGKSIRFYLPSPANITFRISWTSGSEFFIRGDKVVSSGPSPMQSPAYLVSCDEKSKIHLQILDAISKRAHPQNLRLTLEMLASYADIRSKRCERCKRLTDFNNNYPTIRERKKSKAADGQMSIHWEAFHPGCRLNHP